MIFQSNIGKKGVATESFNIITAVMIMGIILLFGGTSVYKLVHNAADVESAQFRQTFNSEIDNIGSKYGSVKYITLDGLKSFEYFCIFDSDKLNSGPIDLSSDPLLSKYKLIEGDLEDGTSNVFLMTDSVDERFLNSRIDIFGNKGYACEEISSNGLIKLKLEGLGKTVRVTFVT